MESMSVSNIFRMLTIDWKILSSVILCCLRLLFKDLAVAYVITRDPIY